MNKLKGLLEKRESLRTEMRGLSDKLTAETRAWTPEEEEKFNAISAQVEALTKTIEAIQATRDADGGEATDGEGGETPAAGDTEERAVKTAEMERRAFGAYIRNTLSNPEETRALTFGNNGAIVPKTIAAEILRKAYDMSPVLAQARVYRTKGTVTIPKYGADGTDDITVDFNDEMATLTAKQGKFTGVDLGSFLAGALAKVSNSLINNVDIDVVEEVVSIMAEAFARFFEKQILVGTAGKTLGLSELPDEQIIKSGAAGVITADDLITLKNRVQQSFRSGGIYIASQETITAIEKLKDGNGQYIFNPDARDGFAGRVFGYPIYASATVPNIDTEARAVYFVNANEAVAMRIAPDLELAILRERFADQHATGIVGWADFDIRTRRTQAAAVLQMA